jgi:hypothetical protein
MRTRRRFQPTLDWMSTRIAPSSMAIHLPVVGASVEQAPSTPVMPQFVPLTNTTDPTEPTDPPNCA